ncbi:MAG: hypothetical protein AAFP77_29260 [Bacteroidota bacterium]
MDATLIYTIVWNEVATGNNNTGSILSKHKSRPLIYTIVWNEVATGNNNKGVAFSFFSENVKNHYS